MKNETYKAIIVQAIKYAPTVLALTCSVKIWMLAMADGEKDAWLYGVNWINWAMNVVAVGVFYAMGRYFGFCWKHRSLCRIALWGYIYYAAFLIAGVSKGDIRPVTVFYVVVVLLISALYKGTLQDLPEVREERCKPKGHKAMSWTGRALLAAGVVMAVTGAGTWLMMATAAAGVVTTVWEAWKEG